MVPEKTAIFPHTTFYHSKKHCEICFISQHHPPIKKSKRFAKFQAKLDEMTRKNVIGKSRKEKNIFTRRGLLLFFDFLESKKTHDRRTGKTTNIRTSPETIIAKAIDVYYRNKIVGSDDRKKFEDLLSALNLSRQGSWKPFGNADNI